MDIIKRLAGMLKPFRKMILIGILLQFAVIVTRLVMPFLTRIVVNDVITQGVYQLLPWLCAGILGLTAVRAFSSYWRGMLFERVSQNVVYDIRTGLYRHLEEMPYSFYDTNRIGEIMSRMTGDIEGVRNLIAGGIVQVFDNALSFFGALIFMGIMSWRLTAMMLLLAPILAVIAYQLNKRIRPAFSNIREQNAVLNTRTQENLAGVHVVKAFAREAHEIQRFDDENSKLLSLHLTATRIWVTFYPLLELVSGMCTPMVLALGGMLVISGQMDLGTLVGVTGYIWLINGPMRQLSGIINMVAQAITSAEKLFYYMDLGANIKEPEDAQTPEAFSGRVVFDHVNFGYGDAPVLKDICLTVEPGQRVAVMGATGSGKTSLVTLLGRYYDIKSGNLYVDGIDVRRHRLAPLRSQIGYVMQETFLYSDSIFENLRYGRPEAVMEQAVKAAQIAQADEFISQMPQGYDTVVGERGLGLSGGQKQRVAIARALLIDPRILVLDDSTSAVDMETEHEIQKGLSQVMEGRTTFIIAHRISSVKDADLIVVLKEGEIAERGTHDELLAARGLYYDMFISQYQDYEEVLKKKAGEAVCRAN